MSPHLSSRRWARRRPSPDDNPKSVALSPWHFMGLGLIAVLVTGVLAAVDRFQERAAASQAAPRPPLIRSDGVKAAKVPEVPPPTPLIEARRPSVPISAPPAPSPAATSPAGDPGQGNRASVPSAQSIPAEASAFQAAMPARFLAAFGEPAPEPAPAPASRPTVVERPSQPPTPPAAPLPHVERALRNAEGPVATASLQPPAPPIRQPETVAPATGTRGSLKTSTAAPTECLPNGLRAVLADVTSRFGQITVVSTHQLNTVNHSAGSIREKLHHACQAVDFRPDRERVEEIKTYLRTRPEIGGVESYRNGIVHMDLKGSEVASAGAQSAGRRQAAAQTANSAQAQAAPPQAAEPTGFLGLFGR